jgi:DNA-binding response OmpR family regulator
MYRILLVEDSVPTQHAVQAILPSSEFNLSIADTLLAATQATAASKGAFDLILLDLSLPDGDGMQLLREWGDRLRDVPVLLLTGTEDVETKVAAFNLGAEDYMVKPISPLELKARIELRLRKAGERRAPTDTIQRGRLTLNLPMMRAVVNEDGHDTMVEFTAKEFRLVAIMAQNEGRTFTRPELVKEVWGKDMHVVNRTVDSHICGARRKLRSCGDYIQSITGSGYRFVVK